ncbi:hypothetical protein SK128_022656 [Halocaridina rubra]|uniref:Uncharacterized protein n=1 Tax=Halocaridina rubra TaxID=373956 RepID=A0AAN8WD71_HALRR
MLPDTEHDGTVTGSCHLELLQIPRTCLQTLPATATVTPDRSQMSPALGWFQATLKFGNMSYVVKIQGNGQLSTGLLYPLVQVCLRIKSGPPGCPTQEDGQSPHVDSPERGHCSLRHSHTSADPVCLSESDALLSYWQMELAKEDWHITTFITQYGRFKHCRGPMGFAATGDAICL